MVLFREQHPELVQNSKKPDVPKGSRSKVPKKFQEHVQKVKPPPENNLPIKWKFHGEPKKPPMNGYHKFHQDLWSSRELKVVPSRERMVESVDAGSGSPRTRRSFIRCRRRDCRHSKRWTLISGSGLCLLKNMLLTERRLVLSARTRA